MTSKVSLNSTNLYNSWNLVKRLKRIFSLTRFKNPKNSQRTHTHTKSAINQTISIRLGCQQSKIRTRKEKKTKEIYYTKCVNEQYRLSNMKYDTNNLFTLNYFPMFFLRFATIGIQFIHVNRIKNSVFSAFRKSQSDL